MRLLLGRALVAASIGVLSAPCFAVHCDTTLRVGGLREHGDLGQVTLQRVTARLGWCLQWDGRDANVARRLAMIDRGDVDVIADVYRTPERAAQGWFSHPYSEQSIRLYVRRADFVRLDPIHSFAQLLDSQATLLTLRNAWMGPEYAQHRQALLDAHRAYEIEHYVQGRGMLLARRADIFIAPDTFSDFLGAADENGIVPLDWALHHEPVYYMFSRKTIGQAQVEQFDRALDAVLDQSPHPAP